MRSQPWAIEIQDHPITPAVRFLREKKIPFTPHLYTYEEHGGTSTSPAALNADEHLVMQIDERKPLIVLMHGDREVSTKQLARILNAKRIEPYDAATPQRHTGYQFGGTSPFGRRTQAPVYAEATIFTFPKTYINVVNRGFLLEISTVDLRRILPIVDVGMAIAKQAEN